ncbi:MAG: GNAT family N-acetyltransferase [Betaproteobacteria bacterium]|nr:GNAT family N-acetyltransferase [Betaproteobacteria bacterium]
MPLDPSRWVRRETLADGAEVIIRPLRAEDAARGIAAFNELSEHARYQRFMRAVNELSPDMLRELMKIDYRRTMAFVAEATAGESPPLVGIARYAGRGKSCEFAIVLADAWQGRGLGSRLMRPLMRYARRAGFKTMTGSTFSTNTPMIELAHRLGFRSTVDPDGASETLLARKLPLRP